MNDAERYISLCEQTRRQETLDCSYHAAFYLLSSSTDIYERTVDHVSIDGVDFSRIKRACKDLSEKDRKLVDIAHNLFSWTSKCQASPYDISRLGYPYMEFVIYAFFIATDQFHVQLYYNQTGVLSLGLNSFNSENMFAAPPLPPQEPKIVRMQDSEPTGKDLLEEVTQRYTEKASAPAQKSRPMEP